MYDLLVLGALLEHDRSGYKLCKVLENALVPRRKISNGVMYPLLDKLAAADDIVFLAATENSRGKRLAHLTPTGKAHLHAMLLAPVPMDAKRESIYRFKFKGMAAETPVVQSQILNDYKNAVLTDLQSYQRIYVHVERKVAAAGSNQDSIDWGLRTLSLQIAESEAKIKWSNQQLEKVQQAIAAHGGITNND
ncbi:transcriptional regulator [Lactobacillus sp. CBA3605]|uniref:PadR family transcriptional regulator n=1 Tax=Lactobacillus sp. CBA3605 TaxID=2099788 RepID=UPI000CFB8DDC|nr:PadR family transcriptional regulator [Lactobacillus sp. CBA3605]AVK60317.1 transcriptional regulator [Lactobacillus sp. CBA3605]